MRRIFLVLTLLVISLAVVAGCSSGGQSPLAPGMTKNNPTLQGTNGTNPLTDPSQGSQNTDLPLQKPTGEGGLQGAHELWGLYQVAIDPDKGTMELVPLRTANTHLNLIKFLEPNGKAGGVQVAGPLQWNSDHTQLDVDIRLVHPFPGAPQFSGFDVKGIVITRGTKIGFSDSTLVMPDTTETRLLNADGYTRWWNPKEFVGNDIFSYTDGAFGIKDSQAHFQSIMNGFKYFADTLNSTDEVETMNQADRGVFRSGVSNIRHYTLKINGALIFNYAIDASWEPPTKNPPVVPTDFPPSANQPEPWRIVTTETQNTLYFVSAGTQGGHLGLDIKVYDWQSPLPTSALGTVKQVVVEWPGVFSKTVANYVSDQGTYALYHADISPVTGALTSSVALEYVVWAESSDGAGYGGKLSPDIPLIAMNRFSTQVSAIKPNSPPVISVGLTETEARVSQKSSTALLQPILTAIR